MLQTTAPGAWSGAWSGWYDFVPGEQWSESWEEHQGFARQRRRGRGKWVSGRGRGSLSLCQSWQGGQGCDLGKLCVFKPEGWLQRGLHGARRGWGWGWGAGVGRSTAWICIAGSTDPHLGLLLGVSPHPPTPLPGPSQGQRQEMGSHQPLPVGGPRRGFPHGSDQPASAPALRTLYCWGSVLKDSGFCIEGLVPPDSHPIRSCVRPSIRPSVPALSLISSLRPRKASKISPCSELLSQPPPLSQQEAGDSRPRRRT